MSSSAVADVELRKVFSSLDSAMSNHHSNWNHCHDIIRVPNNHNAAAGMGDGSTPTTLNAEYRGVTKMILSTEFKPMNQISDER